MAKNCLLYSKDTYSKQENLHKQESQNVKLYVAYDRNLTELMVTSDRMNCIAGYVFTQC